jgi:hypothetical protein
MIPGGMFPPMQGNGVAASGGGGAPRRYNLLTFTEHFDNNAAWPRSGDLAIAANAAVAPDGATTADLIYPTTNGGNRWFTRDMFISPVARRTFSCHFKYSGVPFVYVLKGDGSAFAAWFDIQNGTIGNVASDHTASVESAGSGWFKCSLASNDAMSTSYTGYFGASDTNGSSYVTANGTNGFLVWGASLVAAADASLPYQRVAAASDWNWPF